MMPRALLLALLTLLATPSPAAPQNARLPLDDPWSFRERGSRAWLPATVPGTVHTDLLAAGRIPDPFTGAVEPELQWIEARAWEYSAQLLLATASGSFRHTELRFEGLDTYAEVLLDGRSVLTADNMFRPWRVDAGRLADGRQHEVRVVFRSPIPIEDSLARAYPHKLPAGNDPHGTRVFTRKAAYHYGWDWGPRYVTAGIWRPVTLHQWSTATLRDAFVAQDSLDGARARLRAHFELEADEATELVLEVSSPAGAFRSVRRTVAVHPGMNAAAVPVTIERPVRWWPNGLGAAHLYDVTLRVLRGGETIDSAARRVGLRTVRVLQEPDSVGRSFTVEVNGVPVFMKGANVIPFDHFTPRVDAARYARMFADAKAAHMNMLRVWGGGIYEADAFYDLADEHGILVWQDFMFANGMYPGDAAFLANVRAEAEAQVRRLRQHPSIALWCGNNEMREGWENWGWQRELKYTPADSAAVWQAYERIFHDVLPETVRALDPQRFYWPSSPSIGWGHEESLRSGDAHYWGVWWGEEPFEKYLEKIPRFMSEYGFQAYPAPASVARFAAPAERAVGTPVMRAHQKHPRGDELIRTYLARAWPEPRDFAEFVHFSQLLQADGISLAIEAHRRAMPRTMGTLYWQLNDSWPVVSWSGIDWYGEWKALQHAVRRAFAPVLVSPIAAGDVVRVHLVSDRLLPADGTLTVRTLTFDGRETARRSVPVTLAANTSTLALTLPRAQALSGTDAAHAVLVAELALADGTRTRGLLYFAPPKDLALPEPGLRVRTFPEDGAWTAEVHADALARGVWLEAPGARFADNAFDLLPGETRRIRIEAERQPEVRVRAARGKAGER